MRPLKKALRRVIQSPLLVVAFSVIALPTFYLQIAGPRDFFPYYNWFMFRSVSPINVHFNILIQDNATMFDIFIHRKRFLKNSFVDNYNKIQSLSFKFEINNNKELFLSELRKLVKDEHLNKKVVLKKNIIDKTDFVYNKKNKIESIMYLEGQL